MSFFPSRGCFLCLMYFVSLVENGMTCRHVVIYKDFLHVGLRRFSQLVTDRLRDSSNSHIATHQTHDMALTW